jgi:hypothetical protein
MGDGADVAAMLAAIDMRSLVAIVAALDGLPQIVPALQAWLRHAVDWERDRREGRHYPLASPVDAIPRAELPRAVAASALIGESFRGAHTRDVAAVFAFFDALTRTLANRCERGRGRAVH